jgi:DNA mismatch repair ATPase MutL
LTFLYYFKKFKYKFKGATSKIKDFEDLNNIKKFGFKGKALNAISFLSDITIITKTKL